MRHFFLCIAVSSARVQKEGGYEPVEERIVSKVTELIKGLR